MSKEKISEKQLEKIQAFVSKIQSLQAHVGALEFKKANAINELIELDDSLINLQKEIRDEYGEINLNIKDGSFTKQE